MIALLTSHLIHLGPLLQDTPGAPGGPGEGGGGMNPLFLVLMMVGIFYFVVFMPERKARRRQKELLDSLAKGDKVMTTSGMLGSIVQVMDDVIVLQVDEGVRLKFTRAAIQTKLEAPTDGEKDGKSEGKADGKSRSKGEPELAEKK